MPKTTLVLPSTALQSVKSLIRKVACESEEIPAPVRDELFLLYTLQDELEATSVREAV